MHYPIYLSQIMLHHQELPIHQIKQIGTISSFYLSKNILSLLIISNEFHDSHLVLVEDVNVLLDICQNQFSKNKRNKTHQITDDLPLFFWTGKSKTSLMESGGLKVE